MELPYNKYNTSFIYAIRSPNSDKFYIGSTVCKLSKRFSLHKSVYKSYINGVIGPLTSSVKIFELGDAYIELLEQMNCDSKSQLEKREGDLIRLHKDCCVNRCIAGRNKKQYYEDNADKKKQYGKQYYEDNGDKIKQYGKQYYEDNVDKIKQYYEDNADKIKQYHKDNNDKIKQYMKQYNEDNADKIKQYKKQYYEAKKLASK